MKLMSVGLAAEVMGARVLGDSSVSFGGVSTDTRAGCADALFFALPGEHSDGHQYVRQALEAGAAAAVVRQPVQGVEGTQLQVEDTLRALGLLARHIRRGRSLPVVGITGSVGKTSTRALTAAGLSARHVVHQSAKNYNNEIGVPLTLFDLRDEHTALVLEMAMRGVGQIAWLAEVAEPTIGVVTNIGLSHVELLGSREAIARAKGELVAALPPSGLAVLPADDAYYPLLQSLTRARIVTFGEAEHADYRVTDLSLDPEGRAACRINGQPLRFSAPGAHVALNAAAALAVCDALGVPLNAAIERMEALPPEPMRLAPRALDGGILLLDDTYNAAPDSVRAALVTLRAMAHGGRRAVAALGQMRELGPYEAEAYRMAGEWVRAAGVELLLTVGEGAEAIAHAAGVSGEHFGTSEEAAAALAERVRPGDVVLVKGSRAVRMERIVERLTASQTRKTAQGNP